MLLQVGATIVTLGTLLASTAFAAEHLYNTAAPLKPALTTRSVSTPATTTTWAGGQGRESDDTPSATRTAPRTTVTPGIATTPLPAQTRTGQS